MRCFFLQGKCREDRDSCNSKNNDLFGKVFKYSNGKGDPYGDNNHLHDYNDSNDSDSNSSGEYRKYTEEEQKNVCQWVQNKRFKSFRTRSNVERIHLVEIILEMKENVQDKYMSMTMQEDLNI